MNAWTSDGKEAKKNNLGPRKIRKTRQEEYLTGIFWEIILLYTRFKVQIR